MTSPTSNLPDPDADPAAPGAEPNGFEEQLLQAHLSARLDPQVGRARRGFQQMLAEEETSSSGTLPLHSGRVNWRWTIGLITAAAACAAFGLSLWMGLDTGTSNSGGQLSQGPEGSNVPGLTQAGYTPLEYQESWQSRDLGVYEFKGRPVRAVHRQQWETTRYRDAEGYEVKIETPREQLVLVDAPVQ